MGAKSDIEWTDASWTPLRARVKENAADIARAKGYTSLVQIAERMAGRVGPHCEHCSPGCENCYSETSNSRCLPANGTGLPFDRRSRDLIDPIIDERIIQQPMHWRKGRRIFVCSQTDLFGEWVTDEMIDRVFAVMALWPQHQFQVLTKRATRMLNYICAPECSLRRGEIERLYWAAMETMHERPEELPDMPWPLPNLWLGVSCEDQQRADERIPLLLQTPAAVRFISAEPLLGPIDLRLSDEFPDPDGCYADCRHGLNFVIIGGESGPGARPFNVKWARDIIAQCKGQISCFMKQVGSQPYEDTPQYWPNQGFTSRPRLSDRKGGDPSEWPEDLRVRESPK